MERIAFMRLRLSHILAGRLAQFGRMRSALLCIALVVPCLSACDQNLDLAAVQSMATAAAESKTAFDAIAADFYDSCLRNFKYTNTFDDSVCADQQKASHVWQSGNSILLSYIATLGALATDKQSDFGLQNLASAVAGIPGVSFKSAQQTAVVNAGNGLIGGIFAARRRDALASVMTDAELPSPTKHCPNGCLVDLVQQLTAIAREDYAGTILTVEAGHVRLFYTQNISLAEADLPPAEAKGQLGALGAVGKLIALGYYTDEASALQAIATKRAAVDQYIASLNQILAAHQQIVAALRDNAPDKIIGIVSAFVATYSAQVTSIQKAFK